MALFFGSTAGAAAKPTDSSSDSEARTRFEEGRAAYDAGRFEDAARAFQQAARAAGRPSISLSTDDCQREYERMRANGVEFTLPPTRMDYGGMDAVFDDTCVNLINLHQD